MKTKTLALLILLGVALTTLAHGDSTVATAGGSLIPPVGARIDATNANRYAYLIPQALMFAIEHGLTVNVVSSRRIDWPSDYQRDTEHYSGQVSLTSNGTIQNYVAGLPFPIINQIDPDAGTKIAYNWRLGPFLPRDVSLAGDQKTRAYSIDSKRPTKLIGDDPQRDYRNENNCDQISLMRFGGVKSNPDAKVEWKERGDQCGPDRAAVITTRYSDPARLDESWGYIPALRKWRQFMTQGSYPNQSCTYSCTQVFFEYIPPKTEVYSIRLMRMQPVLACILPETSESGVIDFDGTARFGQIDCQVRQAFVLDLEPRDSTPERTLSVQVYIDAETYLYLNGEFFRDRTEKPDANVAIWSIDKSPDGLVSVVLANDLYIPGDRPNFLVALDTNAMMQTVGTNSVSKVQFNPRAEIYSGGRM